MGRLTNPGNSATIKIMQYERKRTNNTVLTQSTSLQNETSLGLTKYEHMCIEFTKAFISIEYSSFDACVKAGIDTADNMVKKLNEK